VSEVLFEGRCKLQCSAESCWSCSPAVAFGLHILCALFVNEQNNDGDDDDNDDGGVQLINV